MVKRELHTQLHTPYRELRFQFNPTLTTHMTTKPYLFFFLTPQLNTSRTSSSLFKKNHQCFKDFSKTIEIAIKRPTYLKGLHFPSGKSPNEIGPIEVLTSDTTCHPMISLHILRIWRFLPSSRTNLRVL